jgi:hypothetical protein
MCCEIGVEVVRGHRLRPTKLWTYHQEKWEDEEGGYDEVVPPMYRCDVLRIKSLEALKLWSEKHDVNPAICRECAIRLGLEW